MYFLDVESTPGESDFSKLTEPMKELYKKKFKHDLETGHIEDHYQKNARLFAEFSKIVCVCVGKIQNDEILIKTFCSRHEKLILEKVVEILDRNDTVPIVAHNGKDFDFPFLLRRLIIHGMKIPRQLNTFDVKPWDLKLYDTMEMWSGTQWKYKCSLDLMCNVLGIQSPKQGMTGADVAEVYYGMFVGDDLPFDREEEALSKIGNYCAQDVIALARVYCKLKWLPIPSKASVVV